MQSHIKNLVKHLRQISAKTASYIKVKTKELKKLKIKTP